MLPNPTINVAAITGGLNVPSRRFRIAQLVPYLHAHGINLHEIIPVISCYPPSQSWKRPFWLVAALLERVPLVLKSRGYDIVILQRELISTLPTLERFTGKPRVFDVDDSVHLFRKGLAARSISRNCELVVCGNAYLSEWYKQYNDNVQIIPTAIDTDRYVPTTKNSTTIGAIIIGWIGTRSNLKYLQQLEKPLADVLAKYDNCTLRVVSDRRPTFDAIKEKQIEYIPWSSEIEIPAIQGMDIGIMPLEDTDWTRGKCSLKMLQYMSCGLPVVASPVGMNKELFLQGNIGLEAPDDDGWRDGLTALIEDEGMRETMGKSGRVLAERQYSANTISERLAGYLKALL